MAELTILGALQNAMRGEKALNSVPMRDGWRTICEAFPGAWQRNIQEKHGTLLCYPTLYACIMRIAKDIGKLPYILKQYQPNTRIWTEVTNPAYSPVLRKPNKYQTQGQFRESWILSKLISGNTYVLKRRDERNVVIELYVLDPCRVMPMVSDNGDVYYELQTDYLNLVPLPERLLVPARDIIHDREITLHHPLIGVPPLCAAYWPAVKNMRILRSSAEFFGNGAQPGGILTAPGAIAKETAERLADYWNTNFTGANSGRVAVVGDGLKFEPLSAKSVDAQMVEQLRYSDEQICQPFGVPPFKVGIGQLPSGMKADDLNILYYDDALSDRIEHMENLLDEGLGISRPLGVELDLEPLWRMDEGKRAEVESKLVGAMIKKPDEARVRFDLGPTPGGDTLWGQHQDYPLGMLAERDDLAPVSTPEPAQPASQAQDDEEGDEERAMVFGLMLRKELADAKHA